MALTVLPGPDVHGHDGDGDQDEYNEERAPEDLMKRRTRRYSKEHGAGGKKGTEGAQERRAARPWSSRAGPD